MIYQSTEALSGIEDDISKIAQVFKNYEFWKIVKGSGKYIFYTSLYWHKGGRSIENRLHGNMTNLQRSGGSGKHFFDPKSHWQGGGGCARGHLSFGEIQVSIENLKIHCGNWGQPTYGKFHMFFADNF